MQKAFKNVIKDKGKGHNLHNAISKWKHKKRQ